jgi:hypothetical protein
VYQRDLSPGLAARLRRLALCFDDRFDDTSRRVRPGWTELHELRQLSLYEAECTPELADFVCQCVKLEHLCLTECRLSTEFLERLSAHGNIAVLSVHGGARVEGERPTPPIDRDQWSAILGIGKLRDLAITYADLPAGEGPSTARALHLERVILDHARIGEGVLRDMAAAPRLRSLHVTEPGDHLSQSRVRELLTEVQERHEHRIDGLEPEGPDEGNDSRNDWRHVGMTWTFEDDDRWTSPWPLRVSSTGSEDTSVFVSWWMDWDQIVGARLQ